MFKNLTPSRLAVYIAVCISLFCGLIYLLLSSWITTQSQLLIVAIILGVIFVVSYFINKLMLEHFIYRKVKLIYKSIHDQKLTGKKKFLEESDSTLLQNVDSDVAEWAKNTEKEIASLKSLEQYRKNFVGYVSHELKTPIAAIQGYVDTLLEGAIYDTNINKKYLRRTSVNIERLLSIVNDLDIISELESGERKLNFEDFDLKKLAEEVIHDLEYQYNKKKINIGFKQSADKSFTVRADRENIRQVFTNLISNSIKYGKENGETKISFYDMESYVLIEVSDNGIGIENHHLKHIFDRFYRTDDSRSRKIGGSGLGLAIVKHIIEAHNQTINVRSSVDVGSTFGFTLQKVV